MSGTDAATTRRAPARPNTPRSIAIVNQKGGVAKTTTAVSIAAVAGETGLRVLLVDLDPQGSATRWLAAEPRRDSAGRARTVLQVLDGSCRVDDVATGCVAPGVEVLPGTIDLVGVERVLGGQPGAEMTLRAALADAAPRDLILFDCPPTLGLLAVNALVAAGEVLVPVGARAMDLDGVSALLRTVQLVATRLNPGLAVTAVLATQVRGREVLSRDVLAQLHDAFPTQLLPTAIRHSVRLSEAPSAREPITQYDPGSSVAQDYRDATAELLARGAP